MSNWLQHISPRKIAVKVLVLVHWLAKNYIEAFIFATIVVVLGITSWTLLNFETISTQDVDFSNWNGTIDVVLANQRALLTQFNRSLYAQAFLNLLVSISSILSLITLMVQSGSKRKVKFFTIEVDVDAGRKIIRFNSTKDTFRSSLEYFAVEFDSYHFWLEEEGAFVANKRIQPPILKNYLTPEELFTNCRKYEHFIAIPKEG